MYVHIHAYTIQKTPQLHKIHLKNVAAECHYTVQNLIPYIYNKNIMYVSEANIHMEDSNSTCVR